MAPGSWPAPSAQLPSRKLWPHTQLWLRCALTGPVPLKPPARPATSTPPPARTTQPSLPPSVHRSGLPLSCLHQNRAALPPVGPLTL